ncbi:MAG TPA: cation:proton antiporter, partial [Povalibacter sp.]|nr:cation:proton antiporter [Povalibacter sp.]
VLAQRLRLSPIVGYLVAGICISPSTPGYIGDVPLARQLSEIGVILLMFGVGLHFSIADLLRVRRVAVPGALLQIVAATCAGTALAYSWGWNIAAAAVFGISLSVSSTVVLLRALESRLLLHTQRAQIVIGWLIVEDLVTVLVLVLMPAFAHVVHSASNVDTAWQEVALALLVTLGKFALFVALMLVIGTRVIPKFLGWVTKVGSRELFTLAVLTIALGVAYGSSELFGVSLALGAFFAGVVLSESDLSHKAGEDILPLRDAFAVLFFVAVGMLFDWHIIASDPWHTLAVIALVVCGKSLVAFAIVSVLGQPVRTSLTIAAGDSQIGEFSFILIALALSLELVPPQAQTLVLAASIASIAINPLLFGGGRWLEERIRGRPRLLATLDRSSRRLQAQTPVVPPQWNDHVVIVGHGRVGSVIAGMLAQRGVRYAVVEVHRRIVADLVRAGVPAVQGDIADPSVIASIGLERAQLLAFAIPDSFQLRSAIAQVRSVNPHMRVIARTHSDAEAAFLSRAGIDVAVLGERELALRMGEYALEWLARPTSTPSEAGTS